MSSIDKITKIRDSFQFIDEFINMLVYENERLIEENQRLRDINDRLQLDVAFMDKKLN